MHDILRRTARSARTAPASSGRPPSLSLPPCARTPGFGSGVRILRHHAWGITTFATTFLGHQGWLVRSARTCILVDPVLREDFGEAYALGYRVHPPRVVRLEAFPPIDALILSHEHDDHFDIPSLALLDRRIPVFLSTHSSRAGFDLLREMGFVVRPLVPGAALPVGDLEVIPFCGDHLSVNCDDEWDALPFMIRHREGAGSFFSMVDIMMVGAHLEWAKACAPRPGIVTWTNNTLDWSHMAEYLAGTAADDSGTDQCLARMKRGHDLLVGQWGEPAAMLMCAGGFSFHSERAWLNERVFGIDTEAVCERIGAERPAGRFFSTRPGQTFRMEANRLVGVDDDTPFLGTTPRPSWPVRRRDPRIPTPDYEPATGRRELEPGDPQRLDAALQELAGTLVGGILFRSLHSMLTAMTEGRRPTFALVLRYGTQGAASVHEYDASACAFVPGAAGDPRRIYLAGMVCWAPDLLAVLEGRLGPIALAYGRAQLWNAMPQAFRFDLFEALYRTSHPLRRPAEFLQTYRRLRDKYPAEPVVAAARRSDPIAA